MQVVYEFSGFNVVSQIREMIDEGYRVVSMAGYQTKASDESYPRILVVFETSQK